VYLKTRMSNFVLKLSHFYGLMPSWKLMLITSGLAVAFGIIGVFLVKNPGIYNFGLAAIGQAISKLVIVLLRTNKSINVEISNLIDHALFWIMYLILSIPIFIFGWKKIGKKFTLLTIIFLIVSSLVSFGIGQIPGVNKLYIIGNFSHTEINENLKNYMIYEKWNNVDLWALIPLDWNKSGGNIIAQIILSIVYGVILAYFFAIIAIIGGSAGVTGIIGEYYSIFKQKNFGAINAYINLFIILGSVIIGNYLPASLLLKDIGSLPTDVKEIKNIFEQYQSSFGLNLNLSDSNYFEISKDIKYLKELSWKPSLYFSPNFVSTYICNIIFSILLDKLFPRYKLIQCKIYTHHTKEIKEKFNTDEKIVYSFSITKGTGGFSGRELDIITSITLYNHVPRIIYKVRQVDPKAFIAINNITNIDGSIYLPRSKRFSK
uniref:DUF2179 domain-containing protein n=1 Tax=Mycoplasma elephantis TaxID=114882 RepID=UPI000480F26A